MKAYEHFLGAIGGFFKVILIVVLVAGAVGTVGYWVVSATTADEETRETSRIAREWCLDNGGRTVVIDGVRSCFELSEVKLDVGFMGSKQTACKRNPTLVWMRSPNGGSDRFCYSYKRLTEN